MLINAIINDFYMIHPENHSTDYKDIKDKIVREKINYPLIL